MDRVADDVAVLQEAVVALRTQLATSPSVQGAEQSAPSFLFTEDDRSKLNTALGLAAFATAICCLGIVFAVFKAMSG